MAPCGKPLSELDAMQVGDGAVLDMLEKILNVFRDRRGADVMGRRQVELMWDGGDAVIEAFAGFCRDPDSGAVPRPRGSLVGTAREDCLTTAALVRVAAGQVFAEDPDAEVEGFYEITRPDWARFVIDALSTYHLLPAGRLIKAFVLVGYTGAA